MRISPEKDTATAVSLYQLQDEHNEMGKMSIAQTNSNDRRSLVRMPFNLKFRIREDSGRQTFLATSCDIHPCGIQLETDAPVVPQMDVELWPEDNILDTYYVHGEISWVKTLNDSGRMLCGINFKRRVDWNIPLPVLIKTYTSPKGSGVMTSTDFILDSIVDGVFSVDQNWRLTSFNRAAEELTGWKREDALGKTCKEVFKSNCCGTDCVLAESIDSKKPVENKSVFITHANGTRIGATISATPLLDNKNNVVGGVQVFRSAKASMHRAVILDNIADGVFTVDTNWRVTSFNKAAERITGLPREVAIGKPCSEVFHASICGESCAIACSISTGKPETNRCITICNVDGARVPVSICAAPMYDSNGNLIGGVETFRDLRVVKALQKKIFQRERLGDMISKSAPMKKIFDILPQISQSESNVLILGESGTGKELIAWSLHNMSERRKGPFVAVNCGALPDTLLESELFGCKAGAYTDAKQDRQGRFAAAEGGTLFLDEIGDISPAMQVKLLRVLETKCYEPLGSSRTIKANVRIVSATNRDVERLVQEGKFRDDLFYRLNVAKLELPLLRERAVDIPLLVEHFVEKLNAEKDRDIGGVSEEALRILMSYDFPGNIRELQNIIEYAFILCPGGLIQPDHLPSPLAAQLDPVMGGVDLNRPLPLTQIEKRAIFSALTRNGWRRMATCRELGISKDTLRRKIAQFGLDVQEELAEA
ncbi:MAG: sigma-54 interaction domain-containing protein [Desulfurivibrionaceae bacterium]